MDVEVTRQKSEDHVPHPLFVELQAVLHKYLSSRNHLSINSLSKKCQVSEATLRRIYKGQVKTLPNITTILDILSTITGKTAASEIANVFPGPIADFLRRAVPQIDDCQTHYDANLNKEFENPVSYLLYKLSANRQGLSEQIAQNLFGAQGLQSLQNMVEKNYIIKKGEFYFSNVKNFTTTKRDFVKNIKVIADFIKLRFSVTQPLLNPLLANYSESVSEEAYKEIAQLQIKTLEKIRSITSNEKNSGPIPLFLFMAMDTLDSRTAFEIVAPKAR